MQIYAIDSNAERERLNTFHAVLITFAGRRK